MVTFEVLKTGFLVTFTRHPVKDLIPSTGEKTGNKTRNGAKGKILSLIRQFPQVTAEEMAKKTGLSRKGVEWHISHLKKEGKLKRVGGRKAGCWEVLP